MVKNLDAIAVLTNQSFSTKVLFPEYATKESVHTPYLYPKSSSQNRTPSIDLTAFFCLNMP